MNNDCTQTIRKIITLEWHMFTNVNSIDGPAPCQSNLPMFQHFRMGPLLVMNREVLESYMHDLEVAVDTGENLMTLKYARMMKMSDPELYAQIEASIPKLSARTEELVNLCAKMIIDWEVEAREALPELKQIARPFEGSGSQNIYTKFDEYLYGELTMYSEKTLELYYKLLLEKKELGINQNVQIYELTVTNPTFELKEGCSSCH